MDKPRECGCKGCRTCLVCEKLYGIIPKPFFFNSTQKSYVFCPYCNKLWKGWNLGDIQKHPYHIGEHIPFNGIYIKLDFLNKEEEEFLLENIDSVAWDSSQSGRRKQNYGPKCNFKKRKLQLGNFKGFPKFSQLVQDKFRNIPILEDFRTIEQCSLEYDPIRGASIDPHVDDCWIWGERIVTVNLLADSILTLTPNFKNEHYNLHCVHNYPSVLTNTGEKNTSGSSFKFSEDRNSWPVVRIPMPRRSLLVMFGSPRYDWEHQVLREDITSRRVCLAYREFTPSYLPGGSHYSEGRKIMEMAKNFF
ncbi:alpha-ketoglutarate-dependent dioxygenase alkB homolog 4 [Agrilus planipennis]|uniref:Alpha-ketoglutarate-dependent dioxygenase alkB homolog 4 n=1 Tax=Agrilus planipennis TaxID=224129 RepID=A0A1W4X0M0_AGRPL|nr:alpha-ketoglutarate-dependent dioxygenase alkB homolog 4 [Agrilus planipennis]